LCLLNRQICIRNSVKHNHVFASKSSQLHVSAIHGHHQTGHKIENNCTHFLSCGQLDDDNILLNHVAWLELQLSWFELNVRLCLTKFLMSLTYFCYMDYYARHEVLMAVTRKITIFFVVYLFIYMQIDNKVCKTYWI